MLSTIIIFSELSSRQPWAGLKWLSLCIFQIGPIRRDAVFRWKTGSWSTEGSRHPLLQFCKTTRTFKNDKGELLRSHYFNGCRERRLWKSSYLGVFFFLVCFVFVFVFVLFCFVFCFSLNSKSTGSVFDLSIWNINKQAITKTKQYGVGRRRRRRRRRRRSRRRRRRRRRIKKKKKKKEN